MIIVLFGPQGSGKGTQAELIAKSTGLFPFSMGDALRKEVKEKTALGKKIEPIINSGNLVPAEITNSLLTKYINSPEASKGIILDGYPRNIEQLKFLLNNFNVDFAIELDLSEEESLKRIATRRICPVCGKNYNIISIKPKVEGICDVCKVPIVQRDDDKPEEILRRLSIYKNETIPLKKFYSERNILHIVDASGSIEEVNKKIMDIIQKPINTQL